MGRAKNFIWLLVLVFAVLTAVYINPFGFTSRWYSLDKEVNITVGKLKEMMKNGDLKLIDVREPDELIEAGRIPNAVNIPLGEIEEAFQMDKEAFREKYKFEKPDKWEKNLVFSCRSGIRSMRALKMVQDMGYENLTNAYRSF
uniref:Rhodanese domain-containing protein n=1 Tax=Trichobilharzia regenti TaxID=157069 RepID=A0AA85J9S0_TRIRE|nr:unnamed protein product [Trichobilharzia regenti]